MTWRLAVRLAVVVALLMLVTGCGTGANAPSVPIKIENAENLGGIALSLQYDSSVFEVTGIKQGAVARSRAMQLGMPKAGEIQVLVGTGKGISGDGTLVVVECKVLNPTGSSTLTVQVLEARNSETGELLDTQVSEGSFSASSASDVSVDAPVITFSP